MSRTWRKETGEGLQLAVGVAPVVPSAGDDDVVHVGVGEDDAREGAPRAAQVERAGPRHPAVDEGEARVLQHALPVLRRQRAVLVRDSMHVAVLHTHTITKFTLPGTIYRCGIINKSRED
jgi:hypothetical protein